MKDNTMEGICEALTDELNELQQQIHLKTSFSNKNNSSSSKAKEEQSNIIRYSLHNTGCLNFVGYYFKFPEHMYVMKGFLLPLKIVHEN